MPAKCLGFDCPPGQSHDSRSAADQLEGRGTRLQTDEHLFQMIFVRAIAKLRFHESRDDYLRRIGDWQEASFHPGILSVGSLWTDTTSARISRNHKQLRIVTFLLISVQTPPSRRSSTLVMQHTATGRHDCEGQSGIAARPADLLKHTLHCLDFSSGPVIWKRSYQAGIYAA